MGDTAARLLERLDPARLRCPDRDQLPPIRLAMVYRARNTATVTAFLRGLGPGADVRLWALDRATPPLAGHTVGTGPGRRFPLLNRALHRPPIPGAWTILADDDVGVARGSLAQLVGVARAARFDVAQPAHVVGSHVSQPITRRRPFSVAREAWYVEQGPVVLLAPCAADRVLPLPEDVGMGWGVEYAWSSQRRHGLRLGIVDAVGIDHLAPPGTAYDVEEARAGGRRLRAAYGYSSPEEIKRVTAIWRPWRRTAPWAGS